MPEKPKLENAKTEIFRFWRFVFPYAPSNLVSPFGRDVAQRQRGLGSLVRELDLPQAKTEGVLQIDKIRMRFALIRIYRRAAPSVTAYAVPPSSERKALVLRTISSCLSLWERCRAATKRAGSLVREQDLPQAKTEGVLQIDKIRLRLALMQTCPRAAPSVTAYAVPPSSKRKALVLRTISSCLSLWERCRAATERAGSLVREQDRLREFYRLTRYA